MQGGADKQGPNLHGLFGRVSGTKAGYSYSKANQNAAVEWGEKTLFDYLKAPKKYKQGGTRRAAESVRRGCRDGWERRAPGKGVAVGSAARSAP